MPVRLADAVVALETSGARGHAGRGSAWPAWLQLAVSLADAIVAFLSGNADRVADPCARGLDMRLADSVVALLASAARRVAHPPVLQLDLDLAELRHGGLVSAAIAILDLHVDEVVVTVVHLHPGVRVVHLDREPGRLREG